MPSEKFGQGYPVYVGKGERAFLSVQAMPYHLSSVPKNSHCPHLFPSLNKMKKEVSLPMHETYSIFKIQCLNCPLFWSSTSYTAPRLFLGVIGCPASPGRLSSLLLWAHNLLAEHVSGCWISSGITQYCFIKERKNICTLNESSCHHLSALCSEVLVR